MNALPFLHMRPRPDIAVAMFNPGAIPATASIEVLAGLLMASGMLCLLLLRMIWKQQLRLKQARSQQNRLADEIESLRRHEQQLHANERSLREISARMPVVVFTMHRDRNRHHRLESLTGDLQALFGVDPNEALEATDLLRDWPFGDRIYPDDVDSLRLQLRHSLRHARATSVDFRAYAEDGLRWFHLVMAAYPQGKGNTRWVGYLIDTTNLNAHNEALRAARDAAERASRAKADFLATMSHEIRTPMNGVIGMLELLEHTSLNPDQIELLQAVGDSASVLMQILNDVLDFSKLEAGNLRLDPVPFDLRALVDSAVGLVAGPLHQKGLDVRVGMDTLIAGRLLGDDVRLRQILLNLLNNAGKFTEHGSITVSLRVLGDDGEYQRLQFSIADTGIGIPADKQENLFMPFSQAESWTARRHGGTGLGLAICHHLVELMDGKIALSSEVELGTTITVEVRLPVVQREIANPVDLAGQHAVVRLDNHELTAIVRAHLAALGLSVETVPPSQSMRPGIAANILFVDIDDEESSSRIAAHVIALTDSPETQTRPYRDGERIVLGCNPLKWQSMVRACAMTLEPQRPSTATSLPAGGHPSTSTAITAPPSPSPTSAGRILIAEDHPVNQALARRQLALLGWACDIVDNGRAALEALRHNDYALLMTDCQMPEMDGYELAAAWRQLEADEQRTTRLPIIAMTAHTLGDEIVRCRDAGMDDYLSKPVQLKVLQEKLQTWLRPEGQTISPSPSVATAPATQADMLRLLRETSMADLDAIELAMANGDAATVARRLHRLLGALQIFIGGPDIGKARQLLDALEEGASPAALDDFPTSLARLREQVMQLPDGA
ncbi:ATP-binding protein [Dyella sp. A6]|uniref:ATP-binding protein n=1 Tax=Dyella aluminiiresistens TaxID=3069105 RepID=UPI002E75C750|nr:ATP-binding protein [Dyella sp. A6]